MLVMGRLSPDDGSKRDPRPGNLPDLAKALATTGISHAPGTQATSTLSSATPLKASVSSAAPSADAGRFRSFENGLTTTAIR